MPRVFLKNFVLLLSFLCVIIAHSHAQDDVTNSDVSDSTGTVTDVDGNVYKTVKIGNQWWMAENLKVTRYRNGDSITHWSDIAFWSQTFSGAYCNYKNDEGNVATYGRLYKWHAVDDSRNIAPTGWHVPTDKEWRQLEMYLGMSQAQADTTGLRGPGIGHKLKEAGTMHWHKPNAGATNKSGFAALPGGYRDEGGFFSAESKYAYFWSSTEKGGRSSFGDRIAWARGLGYKVTQVERFGFYARYGFSVRCVRD